MENRMDLEQYIRKGLAEMDDLDERRFAKEILLEGLVPVFDLFERKYLALEARIRREIEVPEEKYGIRMTIIRKEDYDPINGTLFPICPQLLGELEDRNTGGQDEEKEGKPHLIYFAGNRKKRQEFQAFGEITGKDSEGKSHKLKVRKAQCYRRALEELYQVFASNRVRWTTVNTGYMDRFYEIYSDEGENVEELQIDYGSYEEYVKKEMLLLWNIEKFTFQCRKFMVPCVDEKYYEHELDLGGYDRDSGYMLGINEDILSVRHEKDKIIFISRTESFRDREAYRFLGRTDTSSHGYCNEILDNSRKESFYQNYLEGRANAAGSRTELFRIMESFENPYVALERCSVFEEEPCGCMEGDMNPFIGETVFPMETRRVLVLYFRKKSTEEVFGEDMARFLVSQIQMSICEYKCVGILEGAV